MYDLIECTNFVCIPSSYCSSLTLLDNLTTEFGQLMRQFRDLTCTTFATVELPREAAGRERRAQEKNTASHTDDAGSQPGGQGQMRE